MTKTILVLIVCLFIITSAAFTTETPAASRMDTPITLAVKGEALSDVVQNLKTQSGVNLTVAKDIADLKVTIFVDKQPLSSIMAGLKTLFHFEWYKKEYTGKVIYEFSRSLKIKNDTFDGYDIDTIRQQLDRKLAVMNDKTQPSATKADETSKAAALMLLGFSPELKNVLIQGCTVCLDSSSSDAQWQVPESLSNALKKTFARENKNTDSVETEPSHSRIRLSITAPIEHKDDTTEIKIITWIHLEQNWENEGSKYKYNQKAISRWYRTRCTNST